MAAQNTTGATIRKVLLIQLLIVAIIGLSGAVAAFLYSGKPTVEARNTEVRPLNVDVYELQLLDFRELLTGFGTARADVETIVSAQVSGEIVEIHPQLKAGFPVQAGGVISTSAGPSADTEGDLLVRIDPRDYQEQVEQAENRIEEARTEILRLDVREKSLARQKEKSAEVLKSLTEEYNRLKTGVERQVSTPSDLNRALIEVQRYEDTIIQLENQIAALPHERKAAQQRQASAESEKKRAENDLKRTRVMPPFSGVLSEVFVERGQFVRSGDRIARLTDLSRVEIPIFLAFEDYLLLQRQVAAGERPAAALARNETAEPLWAGHVVRTGSEADSRSRTVQAYIEVENSPGAVPILPGAFVHARIDGQTYSSAALVPVNAIVNGTVFVVDADDVAQRKPVETGRRFQSLILVTAGLEPGDRVILTNLDIVEEGRQVAVQNTTGPRDEIAALRSPLVRPADTGL